MSTTKKGDSSKQNSKFYFKLEKKLVSTTVYTLIALILIESIAYLGFFKNVSNFNSRFGYYIIFLIISVLINAILVYHVKAYKIEYSHMGGMMIGMTVGMTTGMSIGLIVGATNGMFVGSIVGILLGMLVGGYVGNCCGIMGIMEGMMAGLMGGTMGPMISVMTLNDNVKLLVPLIIISIVLILFGLLIMIYKHEYEQEVGYDGFGLMPFITITLIVTLALSFLMVYGPKSALFI